MKANPMKYAAMKTTTVILKNRLITFKIISTYVSTQNTVHKQHNHLCSKHHYHTKTNNGASENQLLVSPTIHGSSMTWTLGSGIYQLPVSTGYTSAIVMLMMSST